MPRFAAFLRGINVTGRRVTSDQLRASLGDLGFTEVAAFRASGNVIFSADGGIRADKLAARIEEGLARTLGFEVPVFLRTAAEVNAIARHDPFPVEVVAASDGKLQVALLSATPAAQARKTVLALATDQDRLAIRKRELYWLPSGGTQRSELDQKAIGAALGSTTMRTKGTIEQIAAKYFAD
jgi:uncharacterized protein (DUF1697 family)